MRWDETKSLWDGSSRSHAKARTGTGMGQDLGGMGAPIPRRSHPIPVSCQARTGTIPSWSHAKPSPYVVPPWSHIITFCYFSYISCLAFIPSHPGPTPGRVLAVSLFACFFFFEY